MAFSYKDYTGDGVTDTFTITFTYQSTDEISVTVNGVAETGLTFPSTTSVQLTSAPASDALVRVRRTTDLDARAVDFASGSVLTEEDLDNSNIQVFHAAQEAVDTATDAIALDDDNKFDAQSKIIKNVADPVNNQDAVTKNYLENTWLTTADKAQLNSLDTDNLDIVAGNTSNINAVAADATDIGTVSTNIASVNTVATNIADVITVANDLNEAISEIETAADDLNEAVSEIDTVATSISSVNTVGTNISDVNTVAGNISNVNTVAGNTTNINTVAGISGNVTTVAGISSDVTTVAADGTDIGTVATNIANVNSVAGNATNINNVAGNATNINTVAGISADVTTVAGDSADIQAVAADATDIGTVSTNIANVNTVAGSIANVNTTAANITGVNSFAERYRVGTTDPTTSLDEGDLFFNTTDNTYKFYDGSSWQVVNVSGIGSVLDDATPQLGGNLDVNGNDINFGDNDKATFGDNDLSIYHDGSNSYISDQGTGNLRILAEDFRVVNAANSETMIQANVGADVRLYYDTELKLSTTSGGIDVQGSVVSDGLTVDGAGSFSGDISTTGGDVDITGAQPRINLKENDTTDLDVTLRLNAGDLIIETRSDAGSALGDRIRAASNGDISFYDSTGVTQGLFWDASAQRLGLGVTSPVRPLSINTTSTIPIRLDSSGSSNFIEMSDANGSIRFGTQATGAMTFYTGGDASHAGESEAMRITSDGKVGIGTTPSFPLDVSGSDFVGIHYERSGTDSPALRLSNETTGNLVQIEGNNDGDFIFKNGAGTLSEAMRITSGGNVGIGTTAAATDLSVSSSGADAKIFVGRQVTSGNLSNTAAGGSIEFGSADSSTYAEYSGASIKLIADEAWTAGSAQGSALAFFVTADGTASLSEAMRITSSGEIDVTGDGGDSQLTNVFTNSGTGGSDNSVIRVRIGGTTARSVIQFADDDDNNAGQIDYAHDDDAMIFDVNGSQAMRLDSDGLKFNSDTSANNALDDYEQGSWTVDLQDSSGNSATGINGNGRYIKVGNLVTVWGRLNDPDLTGLTSGDDVRIYGLPFTASTFTGDSIRFIGSVRMENVAFSSSPDGYVNTALNEGQTYIRLVETRNNAIDDFIIVSQLGATSEIYFTATYPTTTF